MLDQKDRYVIRTVNGRSFVANKGLKELSGDLLLCESCGRVFICRRASKTTLRTEDGTLLYAPLVTIHGVIDESFTN